MLLHWKYRIPALFLIMSILLFGLSILRYTDQVIQYYFIGIDATNNQGPIWKCGWPLLVFILFYIGARRYHPHYQSGDPIYFFRYEIGICINNATILDHALKSFMCAVNGLIQFVGFYYYLQLFLQMSLYTKWILPASIIWLFMSLVLFCFRLYKSNHKI